MYFLGFKCRKALNKRLDAYLIFKPIDQALNQWDRVEALIKKDGFSLGGRIRFFLLPVVTFHDLFPVFFVSLKNFRIEEIVKPLFSGLNVNKISIYIVI